MMNINKMWIISKIKLIDQEGDMCRYLYLFDDLDEDHAGIIEFDKYIFDDFSCFGFEKTLKNIYLNHRVYVIKKTNHTKYITQNGWDLASVIALFCIYTEFCKKKCLPKDMKNINLNNLERIKDIYPDIYKDIMKLVELDYMSQMKLS